MYTQAGVLDRDSVVEQYGHMVRRTAAQMMARLPANVAVDDLVQAGMIGLLDAVSRYDASQGTQFETFATQRVRGAMLDELRGSDWMPRSVRKSQKTIEAAVRALEQHFKRPPNESEIAAHLKMTLPDYQHFLQEARGAQLVYLEEASGDDGEEGLLQRSLPSAEALPIDRLGDRQFRTALIERIGQLPEREKLVMGLYYDEGMNLKEIGAVLGVTESRVSQLHSQAVARLRSQLHIWM